MRERRREIIYAKRKKGKLREEREQILRREERVSIKILGGWGNRGVDSILCVCVCDYPGNGLVFCTQANPTIKRNKISL